MYTLSIQREFIAQHFLIGGDLGKESELHSHNYKAELMVEGEELDQHGYLIDIIDLGVQLEGVIDEFRDKSLNELDEFEGMNSSVEHFARVLCEKIDDALYAPNIQAISIKLWENDIAWVAYDLEREE